MRFSIYIHPFNIPLDNLIPHPLEGDEHRVVVLAVGSAVKVGFLACDGAYFLSRAPCIGNKIVDIYSLNVRVLIRMVLYLVSRVVERPYIFRIAVAPVARDKKGRPRPVFVENFYQFVGV